MPRCLGTLLAISGRSWVCRQSEQSQSAWFATLPPGLSLINPLLICMWYLILLPQAKYHVFRLLSPLALGTSAPSAFTPPSPHWCGAFLGPCSPFLVSASAKKRWVAADLTLLRTSSNHGGQRAFQKLLRVKRYGIGKEGYSSLESAVGPSCQDGLRENRKATVTLRASWSLSLCPCCRNRSETTLTLSAWRPLLQSHLIFVLHGVLSSLSPLRTSSWWGRRSHEGALGGEGLFGHGGEAELHWPPSEPPRQRSEGDSGLCNSSSQTHAGSHLFRRRLLGCTAAGTWIPSQPPPTQKEPKTEGFNLLSQLQLCCSYGHCIGSSGFNFPVKAVLTPFLFYIRRSFIWEFVYLLIWMFGWADATLKY